MSASASVAPSLFVSCPRCSRRAHVGQAYCELCGLELHQATPATSVTPPRSARCEACGATVLIPASQRSVECAFCNTPYVAAGEPSSGRMEPEFVLPFSLSKSEAQKVFASWIGQGSWFRPGDLAQKGHLCELKGVYVPFWSFGMRSQSTWHARIGEYWWETVTETYQAHENGKLVTKTRTRRVQHTEWYPLSGSFHQFHSHYLVSASRGLEQNIADLIGPFPVEAVMRYAPHFLSGWLCEEYSIDREEAERISRARFAEIERRDIAAFLPGDTSAVLRVETGFTDLSEDLLLLPMWICAYSYSGKQYRFVLNGSTGKAHGDKPHSARRIVLFMALVLIVIALIVLIFGWLTRK